MATRAEQMAEQLNAKRAELAGIFTAHKTDAGELDMPADVAENVKSRNDELTDLGKKWEMQRDIERMADENDAAMKEYDRPRSPVPMPNGNDGNRLEPFTAKSLGQMVIESAIYTKNLGQKQAFQVEMPDIDVKSTITTSAGFAPANDRTQIVILSAVRRPMVGDLVPADATTLTSIRYMEETTFTNAADTVAEGTAKPPSDIKFTERTVPVAKIATTFKITDEQLNDVPQMRGIINNRGTLMIQLAEEVKLLNGTGGSDILGFYQKPSILNTNAGGDPVPDAIYKTMQKIRSQGFAEPSGIVIHPDDWTGIRLLTTADGIYIWGSPSEAGPERIWGLPIVQTPAATAFIPLIGDFVMYSHISRRQGITVEFGFSDDDFTKNLRTVRIEERLSLEIYRASAFGTATLNA